MPQTQNIFTSGEVRMGSRTSGFFGDDIVGHNRIITIISKEKVEPE